jgi:ubiquinone biosynthesis UbiH/UbiF/VisC/COQ6 family hydroxylase
MPDRKQTHARPADGTLDAVVAGGGIVGAAACLALVARGDRVRWLRPALATPQLPDGFAARIYALSPGNLGWLERLGVVTHLDTARLGSVRQMRIRARHGHGLDLSAEQAGAAELALIIESDNLLRALEAALAEAGVAAAELVETRIVALQDRADAPPTPHTLELGLDAGEVLSTRLLVAADGAASPLRDLAGIPTTGVDYAHRAVVANFTCERDHRGIACQWFDNGAVLAWLPLPDRHISMVWSLPQTRAEALLELDADALTAQVAAAGEHRWGGLKLVSPPQSFPLRRQRAKRLTASRMALVGDAAHVVHPLAGQGMNLGLRDVRALLEATDGRRDPGDAYALARYEALRQTDVHSIEAVTDGLFRLFGSPLGGFLGGHGMGVLNHLAPVKSELIRQAMR